MTRKRERESTGELGRREDVGADVMAKGVGVGVGVVVRDREPHQRPHRLHLDVTIHDVHAETVALRSIPLEC